MQPPECSLTDLTAGLAARSIVLIDVREAHEFATGHIPGSRNLPLSRFDPYELPAHKRVVLSCQAGKRAAIAFHRAAAAGKTNCLVFSPGFAGWLNTGLTVESE
jgi:rhodanese-related sulfurtransferase